MSLYTPTEKVFTFVKGVWHSLMTIDNLIYAASKQRPGTAFSSNARICMVWGATALQSKERGICGL